VNRSDSLLKKRGKYTLLPGSPRQCEKETQKEKEKRKQGKRYQGKKSFF
jgi:hypothetical protein